MPSPAGMYVPSMIPFRTIIQLGFLVSILLVSHITFRFVRYHETFPFLKNLWRCFVSKEMVSYTYVGGLLSRAAWLMSIKEASQAHQKSYKSHTVEALQVLQGWYDNQTGLWNSTGWWNSANCLTVLADFAILDDNNLRDTGINIADIIQNTYEQAQMTTIQAQKTIDAAGLPVSSYTRVSKRDKLGERGFNNFLNDYYDDEGWWALALIRSHDIGVQGLGDQQYLQAAADIFDDMSKGNSSCGGIYWSKVTLYTNAIANELYLSVAASLANRMTSNKQYYLDIANKQWQWFENSGLINSDNLINDGLDDNCQNNGQKTWTCKSDMHYKPCLY